MSHESNAAMVATQYDTSNLAHERPKPFRQRFKPKYTGQFAFKLDEDGCMKQLREPKGPAATSRTANSSDATGMPPCSDACSLTISAKRPASDCVEQSYGKTPRTTAACPIRHLPSGRASMSEDSHIATSSDSLDGMGLSAPPTAMRKPCELATNHIPQIKQDEARSLLRVLETKFTMHAQLVQEVKDIYTGLTTDERTS
ncbi:hypothetical protein EDD36DRAFT_253260 [Exophiala viscosa]|uniref:Uncharacterized protein n=1 Tax=Exophiala viscosa TaxID=2486360 RepID=A0AAN6DWT9_9EURO|nr:hypothetical protein EDD36DRAFT_253260 [Exophiala viscosa]